ncbi:hypothetical protein BDR22DRAFT_879699 [Usnea florida]
MTSTSSKPAFLSTSANAGSGLAAIKTLYRILYRLRVPYRLALRPKGEDAIKWLKSESAAEQVVARFGRLDALVNNAGANFDAELKAGTITHREVWNRTWDVSVAGAHLTTESFVPLLLKSSDPHLVFITSATACLAETEDTTHNPMLERINAAPAPGWPKDPRTARHPAYRSVKVGLNMMREWSGPCVSPGFLATGLGGMGAKEPREWGEFVRDVLEGKRDGVVGTAIRAEMVQPW